MNPTPSQLDALRNLSHKHDGQAVGFINIADARALTDMGLAVRSQQGWIITQEGSAVLVASSGTKLATDADKEPDLLKWRPASPPSDPEQNR